MARRRRHPAPGTSETLILDASAVIALAKGQKHARSLLAAAIAAGSEVVVPAVVIAETVRGHGARDAPVNRVLSSVHRILPLQESTARAAGRLLGESESGQTIDAIVVASALSVGGGAILTDDFEDFRRLCAGLDELALLRA